MSDESASPALRVSGSPRLLGAATQAAVILLLSAAAAVGTHFLHPRAPQWYVQQEPLSPDEVTVEIVREKWGGGVVWVDARPREAHEEAHIPGALLLNEQEADALLFEHIEKLQDSAKPIVVYCDGHACQASRKMAKYLRERLPGAEIYVLRGGWNAWQEAARVR